MAAMPGPPTEGSHARVDRETDLTAPLPAYPRPEPAQPRVPPFDIPNWNLTAPIADSFDLFEEGQTDVFDFLPTLAPN
jgi:hypothetical protein